MLRLLCYGRYITVITVVTVVMVMLVMFLFLFDTLDARMHFGILLESYLLICSVWYLPRYYSGQRGGLGDLH